MSGTVLLQPAPRPRGISHKPADPDRGESTVEEKTLGHLPNPLQKYGVKFAATYSFRASACP